MKSLFCVVGLSGTNGGNAKDIGARLDMIESTTGRSRPDFRGLAPLSTVHRSFGRSTSILQRGQVKRVTSEPRKMHSHFMERSSKGSCQENSSRGSALRGVQRFQSLAHDESAVRPPPREREARPILSTTSAVRQFEVMCFAVSWPCCSSKSSRAA